MRFAGTALVAMLAATPFARAQSAHSPVDSEYVEISPGVRAQARQRWNEGIAASDAGDFEVARAAFYQAYALIPHPATLRNLGLMELETGRFVDAARHLSEFLESGLVHSPELEEGIDEKLRDAERMVARLVIVVSPSDAVITVDGSRVPFPLRANTWHVAPGKHVVEARLHSVEVRTQEVEILASKMQEVRFDFSSPASPSEAPAPTAILLPVRAALPSPDQKFRSTQMVWPQAKQWAVIGGGVLTMISAGAVVGGAIKVKLITNDADELRAEARSTLGGQNPCSGDARDSEEICRKLTAKMDDSARAALVANIGLLGVGVFGTATVAAWLLWPNESPSVSTLSFRNLDIWASQGGGGWTLQGQF